MMELTAARAEVETAAAADATRVVTAELEALCGSSISSSVAANGGTNDELKLAREAAREQVAQWAAVHPQGHGARQPRQAWTRRRRSRWGHARRPCPRWQR
jgi:hypothetical protein